MNLDAELYLGGLAVPLSARLNWSQNYEPIGGTVLLRMQSGAAIKQTHWTKTRTTISAEGNLPPGVDGLDYANPMQLRCAAHRQIAGSGLVYTLPAARRADANYTPKGYAWVNGVWVLSALALATNTATLTAVSGATAYRVIWWPELQVFADPPTVETDLMGGSVRWTLTAEEL